MLASLLSPATLLRMCQVSWGWRTILNTCHTWRHLAARTGVIVHGPACDGESEDCDLDIEYHSPQPLCKG